MEIKIILILITASYLSSSFNKFASSIYLHFIIKDMLSKKIAEINKPGFLTLHFGKLLFILGIMLMISVSTFAQDPPPPPDGDPDAPFDGGVSLLVAAGVAYGARQWHKGRKNSSDEEPATEPEH